MYTTLEHTKTQLTLTHVTAAYKKSSAAVLTLRMVFACVQSKSTRRSVSLAERRQVSARSRVG